MLQSPKLLFRLFLLAAVSLLVQFLVDYQDSLEIALVIRFGGRFGSGS
jgi:hypothetical protein